MTDAVQLRVDGQVHAGWTTISIQRDLNAICGAFELSLSGDLRQAYPAVRDGAACTLYIGDTLLITGWVEEFGLNIDAGAWSVRVRGRDKTGDLVDCSAMHVPGSWRGQKLEAIANDLVKPFGLSLQVEHPTGAAFANFALEQGETVFEALTRLARLRGLMLSTTATGQPRVFSPTLSRTKYGFELGRNIRSLSVSASSFDRFSDYILIGQQSGANVDANDARAVRAQAADPGMTRYRPLKIVSDDQSTISSLTARARWEATAHMAASQTIDIVVPGWRPEPGELYAPGVLVTVILPPAYAPIDMAVGSVVFSLTGSEFLTQLTLVPPEAFRPEPIVSASGGLK